MPPTLQADIESFLDYIGANFARTRRTYRAATQHLVTYLRDEWQFDAGQVSAICLTPEILHRYPVWLAQQTWQPSKYCQ